jgi:hypothetical protein
MRRTVLVLLLALAFPSAASAATWTVEPLPSTGSPAVWAGPAGDRAVSWTSAGWSQVVVRVARPGAALGAPSVLESVASPAEVTGAWVTFDAAGDALAEWDREDGPDQSRVRWAYRPAEGAWSAAATLAAGEAMVRPVTLTDGRMLVLYRTEAGGVEAAVFDPATETFAEPQAIADAGARVNDLELTALAGGGALAAWNTTSTRGKVSVLARAFDGTSWGQTERPPSRKGGQLQILLSAGGTAYLITQRWEARPHVTRRLPDGTWTPSVKIAVGHEGLGEDLYQIEPDGRLVQMTVPFSGAIELREQLPDGTWTPISRPCPAGLLSGAGIGVDEAGEGLLVCLVADDRDTHVIVATRPAGGDWSSMADLGPLREYELPSVDLGGGTAVVGWSVGGDGDEAFEASALIGA